MKRVIDGQTEPRFTIILSGIGGELDRRTAETPEEARNMVVEIAAGMNDFHGGDSIRVIETDG
jgi:hypothetical protein